MLLNLTYRPGNFIRIYLMQQTRIEMSKKLSWKVKDLSKARDFLPIEVLLEVFPFFPPIQIDN